MLGVTARIGGRQPIPGFSFSMMHTRHFHSDPHRTESPNEAASDEPRSDEPGRIMAEPDPALCPLCGDANACAMAAGAPGPCWCESASFPPDVLASVPPESQGRTCICAQCARKG
jgi:hypothetical protein